MRLLLFTSLAASAAISVAAAALKPDGRGRLQTEVTLRDGGLARFVVDTGTPRSLLTERLATRLGLRPTGQKITIRGPNGPAERDVFALTGLRFEGDSFDVSGPTLPMRSDLDPATDELLGLDVLASGVVEFDFAHRRVGFASAPPPTNWSSFALGRTARGQLTLELEIAGRSVQAVLNTAAPNTIASPAAAAAQELAGGKTEAVLTMDGLKSLPTFAATLEIGGMAIPARLAIGEAPDLMMFAPPGQPLVMLGADVFAGRTLRLDIQGGRGWISPPA